MKKAMKKADARLADARKYVTSYNKPKQVQVTKQEQVTEKVDVPTNKKGMRVESAEIKKLEKGHFFVVVKCNGKLHEINKRFKSTTKAQEWISKHEYVEI